MNLKRFKIYSKQASMMIRDVMIYRADFISRYISTIIRFMIAAFLWLAILRSSEGSVAGYDVPRIMTYFLLMQVVTGFIFSAAMSGFRTADQIQSGDLSTRLIQPVDYIKLTFAQDFGRGLFFFFSNLVIVGLIAFFFQDYFLLEFQPQFLAFGFLAMIGAFILNFSFVMIIGMSAFWITSSHRLIFHFFAILQLLSGMLVPIEFFPDKIEALLLKTPFPYIAYFPIKLFQSSEWSTELTQMSVIALSYSLLLIGITYAFYKFGLRKYEAVGR
jgi:ABC-2 type transport system permease protein